MPPEPESRPPAPVSTYRLQFNRDFTFARARGLVPYLARLGVGDLYASPYLEARPGSTHGYDIIDHASLNPEIGSGADHTALMRALREHAMGHMLDIVPNHMGIGTGDNFRWQDVLENGPSSSYAPFFDIDWRPLQPERRGKVLLPVLGGQFGVVLENGELQLRYEDGHFRVRYHERAFPIAPGSATRVLRAALERLPARVDEEHPDRVELESILYALDHLPPRHRTDPDSVAQRRRENSVTRRRLAALHASSSVVQRALHEAVRAFNGTPGEPRSFDALEALLDDQSYRLAYWRVAAEEINYRRFFDINDLAGVRVEVDRVFRDTHELILRLVTEGKVTALRIDHPDGLFDPPGYLRQLQHEASRAAGQEFFPILVEKILTDDEMLPTTWPVSGTVGYEFMNRLNGLFVDASNRAALDAAYDEFAGEAPRFAQLVYDKKRLILRVSLASELNVLAHLLNRLSERHRRFRDFTLNSLRDALRETIACFPVYRTYIDAEPGRIGEDDRAHIQHAVRTAIRRNRSTSATVFNFIERTLLLQWPEDLDQESREEHALFVMKFQQLTGPVMAKGVEDTSFYIFNRLVSLNEVGGEPDHFGVEPDAFHAWVAERHRRWPRALNSTSTHDTKRSEDVRARINVLSELPERWREHALRWQQLNQQHRVSEDDLVVPDPNDEYLLYQTLVGAWPLEPLDRLDDERYAAFVGRIQGYMEKATREAKLHTSWINPNDQYDQGLRTFVERILERDGPNPFLDDLLRLQEDIARFGMLNALSQVLVKLAGPGVPDVYRGQELWDLSLVDPDNRRPVDWELRQRLLAELDQRTEGDAPAERAALAAELLQSWPDGRIKLYLTATALRLRRREPELMRDGDYVPLRAEGARAAHVFAFARRHAGREVVAVAPRLWATLHADAAPDAPLADAALWADTTLPLPPGRWASLLDGEGIEAGPRGVEVAEVLGRFPVALLEKNWE